MTAWPIQSLVELRFCKLDGICIGGVVSGRVSRIRRRAILLSAFVVAGTAGVHDRVQLGFGLFLLGLGWSCTLIAGSTLLTESIPLDARPTTQGAADLTMGMSGAAGALLPKLL